MAAKTRADGECRELLCQRARPAGAALQGEPVVGGGEGGQKEAAEGDLFGDGREQYPEGRGEPRAVVVVVMRSWSGSWAGVGMKRSAAWVTALSRTPPATIQYQ